ncbi:hypothetical protein [Plasmodium yoelii yoelii]|uniref:Uncharacterized protein n=1 Tax=Plasmodium yoelii yoelii TaxID=73239 RepID=Q7REE3_PLAYO|nr:hypothetical protein [Plasmodium yoelii yoelii]
MWYMHFLIIIISFTFFDIVLYINIIKLHFNKIFNNTCFY